MPFGFNVYSDWRTIVDADLDLCIGAGGGHEADQRGEWFVENESAMAARITVKPDIGIAMATRDESYERQTCDRATKTGAYASRILWNTVVILTDADALPE